MSDRPTLSIVIAASDSLEAVERTLASLRLDRDSLQVELVVAASAQRIPKPGSISDAKWVSAEPGTGVPRLRRLGLEMAAAPLVAFTEDSCVLDPGWADAWLQAFRDPSIMAATGPIVADFKINGTGDTVGESPDPQVNKSAEPPRWQPASWAVFFCEYAPFLSVQSSVARRLAGNNFAVRVRPGLFDLPEIHESEVTFALASRSGSMVNVASARAHHVRRYGFEEALGDRFRFGLEFGQLRAHRHSALLQRLAVFAAPAIFAVQLARLVSTVLASGHYVGPFLASLPIIVLLLGSWSLGESLGWAMAPRDSASDDKQRETRVPPAWPPSDQASS